MQNSPKVAGQTPKYNWTLPSLALITREEGFSALYKGFTPKVLRLAPGGGVLLLVVEVVGGQFLGVCSRLSRNSKLIVVRLLFSLGFFRSRLGPEYE